MPAGGKGKKKKAKSPEEVEKELQEQQRVQLCLIAQQLEAEEEKEDRDFNDLQQQRERVNYYWIVSKKQLEDLKTQKTNKQREIQDQREKYDVEIKSYKQKVKHLLQDYQSAISDQYNETERSRKQLEDSHRDEESLLKYDIHTLQLQLREMELQHEDYLKTLKQEHDRRITEKRQEIERRSEEHFGRYSDIITNLKETMEAQLKEDLETIDRRKKAHIDELRAAHERAFADIKNYYNDITHNNLDLIKSLKEEVAALKKKEAQDEKMMYEIAQENKNMAEPLSKALEDVKQLRAKLGRFERDKKRMRDVDDQLLVKEGELGVAEWEFEVLKQRFSALEFERNRMYESFQDSIYDVQQKSGFRNLLLERRLSALKEDVVKKEAQLNEVLSQASLDTSVMGHVTRKLDDLIEGRNQQIRDHQSELERVVRAHNATIEMFEGRLLDYCVPVEELGFRPRYAKMPDIDILTQ